MKRSKIVMKTDAILYIVLFGAILAVSAILLTYGAAMVPAIGYAFAILAAIGSGIGFMFNAFNLVRICRTNSGE